MSSGHEWKRLPVPAAESSSILYYRFWKAGTGFVLNITNLFQIWKTEYSRRDVLRQAAQDKTSIDPNEDPSQFDVLVSKIGECLAGAPHSRLSFRMGESDRLGSFWMRASILLPAPLNPLEWQFLLQCCSPRSFTSEIVIPLIDAQALSGRYIQTLRDMLEQKDAVISKLLDKLESLAVDLGSVFPGVVRGSKRSVSVQQVSKIIPGLSRFNYEEWQRSLDPKRPSTEATRGIVEHYDSLLDDHARDEEVGGLVHHFTKLSLDWTNELPREYKSLTTDLTKFESEKPPQPRSERSDTDATASDDDFERQETPPEHNQPATNERGHARDSSSESLNTPQEISKGRDGGQIIGKLGILGGKKKKAPDGCEDESSSIDHRSLSGEEDRHPRTQRKVNSDSDSTDDLERGQRPVEKSQEREKAITKLGTIGGKRRQQQKPSLEISSQEADAAATLPPTIQTKLKPKLGAIGGHKSRLPERNITSPTPGKTPKRKADDSPASSQAMLSRTDGQKGTQHEISKTHAETEEEKADRKRNELRSQLERGPTQKKKRKF